MKLTIYLKVLVVVLCPLLGEAEHYILEGTRSLAQKLLEMFVFQQALEKKGIRLPVA